MAVSSVQLEKLYSDLESEMLNSVRITLNKIIDENPRLKGAWETTLGQAQGYQNNQPYWKTGAQKCLRDFISIYFGSDPRSNTRTQDNIIEGTARNLTTPPATTDDGPVTDLEVVLKEGFLSSKSSLPTLSVALKEVAGWLESFQEEELTELALEARGIAAKCDRNQLHQQADLFTAALEIKDAAVELVLALRKPTGHQAIIETGRARGSSKEEILAAAKLLGKEKLKEIQGVFSTPGTSELFARMNARKLLQVLLFFLFALPVIAQEPQPTPYIDITDPCIQQVHYDYMSPEEEVPDDFILNEEWVSIAEIDTFEGFWRVGRFFVPSKGIVLSFSDCGVAFDYVPYFAAPEPRTEWEVFMSLKSNTISKLALVGSFASSAAAGYAGGSGNQELSNWGVGNCGIMLMLSWQQDKNFQWWHVPVHIAANAATYGIFNRFAQITRN